MRLMGYGFFSIALGSVCGVLVPRFFRLMFGGSGIGLVAFLGGVLVWISVTAIAFRKFLKSSRTSDGGRKRSLLASMGLLILNFGACSLTSFTLGKRREEAHFRRAYGADRRVVESSRQACGKLIRRALIVHDIQDSHRDGENNILLDMRVIVNKPIEVSACLGIEDDQGNWFVTIPANWDRSSVNLKPGDERLRVRLVNVMDMVRRGVVTDGPYRFKNVTFEAAIVGENVCRWSGPLVILNDYSTKYYSAQSFTHMDGVEFASRRRPVVSD